MISFTDCQLPVLTRPAAPVRHDRVAAQFGLLRPLGDIYRFTSEAHAFRRFWSESCRVYGLKVGREFRPGLRRRLPQFRRVIPGGTADLDGSQFPFGYRFHMGLDLSAGNRSRLRTDTPRMVSRADVVLVTPGHNVTAGSAPDKPGEESRRTGTGLPGGAGEPHGQRREGFRVKDRFVGRRVGVGAHGEFAQVDPVSEQVAESVRGHSKLAGNLDHRDAGEKVTRRLPDFVGPFVGHELSGGRVTPVSGGSLSPLPDTPLDRRFNRPLETLTPLLQLVLIDRRQKVPLKPPRCGGAVDVLPCRVDHPADRFNLIPKVEHQPKVTPCPREVGDHDSLEAPGLDTVDSLTKDGPGGIRTLCVQFGVEHVDPPTLRRRPRLDFVRLFSRRAKMLTASHERHAPVSCEHGRGVYAVKTSRGTTNDVRGIGVFRSTREVSPC